jgi:hypothetical protein
VKATLLQKKDSSYALAGERSKAAFEGRLALATIVVVVVVLQFGSFEQAFTHNNA